MKEGDRVEAKPYYLSEWAECIEGLETLIIQNKKMEEEPDVVVVFLHGYGSNAARTKKTAYTILNHSFLPPTTRFLQPDRPVPTVRFLLPEAPHNVSDGVFGWWPIPNISLLTALVLSGARQLEHYAPEGTLQECRQLMNAYLNVVLGMHSNALFVLGGFSQGSLLASDLLVTHSCPRDPDVLVLMSTTLIEKDRWKCSCDTGSISTTIVQTHGTHDPVLAFGEAHYFHELLAECNRGTTTFFPFEGGHNMSLTARRYVATRLETYVYEHWTPSHFSPSSQKEAPHKF